MCISLINPFHLKLMSAFVFRELMGRIWNRECGSFNSSVQSLSRVWPIEIPWTATCQDSLSIINCRSPPKPMSIELVMPSSHLILCHPLLLLPPNPPSIRVFSNESALCIRWPKYWSFSFNISPSNEHSGLISFRMDWLDLLAVQGTLKSLLQHHSSKALILRHSAFFIVQLSHPYMTTGKTTALTRWTLAGVLLFHTRVTAPLTKLAPFAWTIDLREGEASDSHRSQIRGFKPKNDMAQDFCCSYFTHEPDQNCCSILKQSFAQETARLASNNLGYLTVKQPASPQIQSQKMSCEILTATKRMCCQHLPQLGHRGQLKGKNPQKVKEEPLRKAGEEGNVTQQQKQVLPAGFNKEFVLLLVKVVSAVCCVWCLLFSHF